MLTALLDGRVMADRHGGGAPSVVALHGWGRDSGDWRHTLDGLDALALDLPGHGNTPAPEVAHGSAEYAELVIEAIAAQPSTPVTLVGHSFGGRVAVHVAARRPDLVAALVLSGVPLYRRAAAPARPPLRLRVARALHRRGIVGERYLDTLRDRYGSPDYRATSGVMRSVFVRLVNEDYDDAIAAVAAAPLPVALVWGAQDTEVPVATARRIAEALPRATLRIVEGSGHLLDAGLAAALREAIAATLTAHPGR